MHQRTIVLLFLFILNILHIFNNFKMRSTYIIFVLFKKFNMLCDK